MQNQKQDPSLLTALSATSDERDKSPELSYGYLPEEKTWEVIVRYAGNLSDILLEFPEVSYEVLSGGYGILHVPTGQIDAVSDLEGILYMEKPHALYFESHNAKSASCINALQTISPGRFSGNGVLVGIIDSGIDYAHPDFRKENGNTRILALWDQTLGVFTEEEINAALSAPSETERNKLCPSVDLSGHGTHVAGIAAGNGAASLGLYRGVAYESSLVVVKLASSPPGGFPGTTQLMRAVDFCLKESIKNHMPLALNLSYGNTYGSHSGTSLIETYLDDAASMGQCSIAVGSGNEGSGDGHTGGVLGASEHKNIEFSIGEYTTSLNIQIWKRYEDTIELLIDGPGDTDRVLIPAHAGILRHYIGQTEVLINHGEPSPYSIFEEISLSFIPTETYLDPGIWRITLIARDITDGTWEMWMPSSSARNSGTHFLAPSASVTLTIPSTAYRVITVGAYDAATDRPASFSGRGNTWGTNQRKPDLVAPGVDIVSCAPGGGYITRTGTSMATPFVTGSCALMMQWGILLKNDPFLYGEKLKAYLHRGARKLSAFKEYPNPQVGWGALCLKDSLP